MPTLNPCCNGGGSFFGVDLLCIRYLPYIAGMKEGRTPEMLEQAKELLSQLPNVDFAGMLGSHMMYSHTDHFGYTDVYPVSMSNLEGFVEDLKKALKG